MPWVKPEVKCGLWFLSETEKRSESVPLVSVEVKAAVIHAVGQVEITQVYKNDKSFPIETVYFFPLDSCAAVTHFQAEFEDGTVVKGIVKTKEDAEEEYKEAVKKQKTAFLGEQVRRDVFNIKVGHLNPGVQVKVVIGYVTEVKNHADTSSMRFVLPTTVAPRYTPPGATGIVDGANNAIQHCAKSPVPLSINLAVSMNEEIQSISSPTHSILSQPCDSPGGNWSKWLVTLKSVVTEMDRDFVVLVTPKEISKPRLYKSIGEDGSTAVMVHLIPSFKLKDQKSEFVILVDRSGSMGGNRIQLAKKALMLFLHSLPEDCYFNILGFGSTFRSLFLEGSTKYDERSLRDAMAYAELLQADMGGTELANPLLHVLSSPPVPSYVRQAFVITDGEVSNTEQVIGIARRHSNHSRVFSLGIGASASTELVRGIAKAGGGTCAFVESDENIAKQTLSQLKNAMQPALSEVSVKWTGISDGSEDGNKQPVVVNTEKTLFGYNKPIEPTQTNEQKTEKKYFQAPAKVPPIFDGSQLVVVGIFPKEVQPTGVIITAESPDGPLKLELKLNDDSCTEINSTSMLHKLAAVKVVEELEAEESYGTESLLERQRQGTKTVKEEICEVALKHGIVSKYTSFIAVKEGPTKGDKEEVLSPMRTEVVPAMIPSGSGMQMHQRRVKNCGIGMGYVNYCSVVSNPGENLSFGTASSAFPSANNNFGFGNLFAGPDSNVARLCRGTKSSKFQTPSRKFSESVVDSGELRGGEINQVCSDSDRMHSLVKLQSFSGSFELTDELCKILGVPLDKISDEVSKKSWNPQAFATCLAIAYFNTKLNSLKDQWELVVFKAEKWLRKNFPDTLEAMNTEATTSVNY